MKLTCPISGFIYFSSSLFKSDTDTWSVVDKHPIFRLETRSLLAKARNYGAGKYDINEERLLFLALLNKTNAIIWEHIATPDNQTVKKYMEPAFKLLAWYDTASPGTLKLPLYRVTEINSNLQNIGSFINAWYEVRQEWMSGVEKRQLAEQLEAREFIIHKLIHSSNKKPENYAGRLASWAMDAAGIEEDLRPEYTDLFKLKGDAIFNADLDELIGMQATFQQRLYAPGSYGEGKEFSGKVLEHIDNLVKVRQAGRLGALGGYNPANTFRIKPYGIGSGIGGGSGSGNGNGTENNYNESFNLDDEIALIREQLKEAGAPEVEPKSSDPAYKNSLGAYMKARASWVLTQHLRDDLEMALAAKSRDTSGV